MHVTPLKFCRCIDICKIVCNRSGRIGDVPIMLAKPQTFMNASGESVSTMLAKQT